MIRLSSVLAGLALGALVAPVSAQEDLAPVTAMHYAKYDMATHTCTILDGDPDVGPTDSTPTVLYDNSTTNGYFTTGSGAIKTTHFMDWGTFTTGPGLGATITEFRMSYVTNVLSTTGPVVFRMRFYDGATGNGNKGTVNANGDLLITGLPNSASGGFEGWNVDVTLATPITLADGSFGWSYNSDSAGGTTGTGPFLVGPPNGPGAGAVHPAPATGMGSYDRITESTDTYLATVIGTTVMLSLPMRLKGREIGGGPAAWTNYGDMQKVTLIGSGSGTPGSTDNNIHVKVNPSGKSFVLVAGLTQSDFTNAHLGLHFQAFPWIVELAPIATPLASGVVDLPTTLPVDLTPGTFVFMQAFGQNLANKYVNWSEGLQLLVQ